MSRSRCLIVPIFLLIFSVFSGAQVVDNQLGKELLGIFPELEDGYIDLNGNGKPDQLVDLDEVVVETTVKDGVIQVQEILDFIENYFQYISIQKIEKVREILELASGAIPEIISLSYIRTINDILETKRELGTDGIFLSPSAMAQAMEEAQGFIASMAFAYKKEGDRFAQDFVTARENLFRMIEQGYPLPEITREQDLEIVITTFINTIIRDFDSDIQRVKSIIRTLGNLGAESSLPYLTALLNDDRYKLDVLRALGAVGHKSVIPILIEQLDRETAPEARQELIIALGDIGGEESLDILLSLLKDGQEPESEQIVLSAVGSVAASGSIDRRISTLFLSYLGNVDIELRKVALEGLAYYPSTAVVSAILQLLKTEKNESVRLAAVKALGATHSPAATPTFTAMLRDSEESEAVVETVILGLGDSAEGLKALPYVLESLGSSNDTIRSAAALTVARLFNLDARAVSTALSRGVLTRTDELYLSEGTRLLAAMADPSTVPTLTILLDNSFDEVKKNATWALYRISAEPNLKTVEALKKLVTSETEALTVRINAVRGLGNIGIDSPQLKVWQTLTTIVRLRGEKYYMLRYFAIEALGALRSNEPEVKSVLVSVALREPDDDLKKASVIALKEIGDSDSNAFLTLENLYKRSDNVDLKILIVETLGDFGAAQSEKLAAELLDESPRSEVKRRIIYSLSNIETVDALNTILDAASDPELGEYIYGVLEDCNRVTMMSIISRRLKTETNGEIRALMENLLAGFQASY